MRATTLGAALGALTLICASASTWAEAPASKGVQFFESRVRPILADRCHRCHGPESGKGKAGLRVDSLEALLRGGDSGSAIVRGQPDKSLLILAVRHDGAVAMPPKSKLAQPEVDAMTEWVKMGAHWPDYAGATAAVAGNNNPRRWNDKARAFWAFRQPEVRTEPVVGGSTWPRSPVEAFIAIGPKMLADDDPVKQQVDIVDEQLDTNCRVFLQEPREQARWYLFGSIELGNIAPIRLRVSNQDMSEINRLLEECYSDLPMDGVLGADVPGPKQAVISDPTYELLLFTGRESN